jgi:hypothetical protein
MAKVSFFTTICLGKETIPSVCGKRDAFQFQIPWNRTSLLNILNEWETLFRYGISWGGRLRRIYQAVIK